jgi:isoquinoline 1-oxidoreductase alpha subunit
MARMPINLTVNGQARALDVDPDTPLLWAIRETLGLTGTKFGCGISACGACTVHVNGKAERSCIMPVSSVEGASITTIEGLAQGGQLHPVQQAWLDQQVPQCGYCQSGMIMAVSAMLAERPHATDAEVDEIITNICRCGTFARIRNAIHGMTADRGGA